jgi:hypothetical protein
LLTISLTALTESLSSIRSQKLKKERPRAIFLVMNTILSQAWILNANINGLAIFALVALGTFTAGIQVGLLGLVMALTKLRIDRSSSRGGARSWGHALVAWA